jgi:transcriptional regulator with XRE-family HTH domain
MPRSFNGLSDFSSMDSAPEKKLLKDFGERLKNLRTEKNLSTRALALNAEMDFGNINEIENGKINPSLITIIALAEALNVDPVVLIHGKS